MTWMSYILPVTCNRCVTRKPSQSHLFKRRPVRTVSLVREIRIRDGLLNTSHMSMKSNTHTVTSVGVLSIVPSQYVVRLSQLLPLAILLCLY